MKSYIWKFLIVCLFLVLVAGLLSSQGAKAAASSQTDSQQTGDLARTVQVTGVAEGQVEPDTAVVRLGVQTEAKTAQQALDQNNTRMQSLLDSLGQAKIPPRNIQTQTVRLSPRYEFDTTDNSQTLVGYTATNAVEVRSADLDSLGALLDKVVQAGANTIEDIHFETSSSEAVLDQVRKAAVQDARHKAEQLAQLAGAGLGPIVEIHESSSTPTPIPLPVEAPATSAAVPVSPGSQTVSVQVQMTWSLINSTTQ